MLGIKSFHQEQQVPGAEEGLSFTEAIALLGGYVEVSPRT